LRRLAFNRLKPTLLVSLGAVIVLTLVASSSGGRAASSPTHVERVRGGPTGSYIVPVGIHKIKHVIVIQQENRSFDSYFATFPDADGIPIKRGRPTVCVIDPASGRPLCRPR
jgi:phospholipase C